MRLSANSRNALKHRRQPLSLEDIPADATVQAALSTMAKIASDRYNECVLLSMDSRTADKGRCIVDTLRFLGEVEGRVQAMRRGQGKLLQESDKPLPSNLIFKRSFAFVHSYRAKLSELLEKVQTSDAASRLSDVAKQELLGYAVQYGKHFLVATKLKGLKMDTTRQSLLSLLRWYKSAGGRAPLDARIRDVIYDIDQEEVLRDACENEEALMQILEAETLAGIQTVIAFVGRAARLLLPPNQMDPWAQKVQLASVIRFTSVTALVQNGGRIEKNGDAIDVILLGMVGNPAYPGTPTAVQTHQLLRHPGLYDPEARLAACFHWLSALYRQDGMLPLWAHEELALIEAVCDSHTETHYRGWNQYMQHTKTEDFSLCLVTESETLHKHFKCPHPGKFILALWCMIRKGHRYHIDTLRRMHLAVLIDTACRAKLEPSEMLSVSLDAEAILHKVWAEKGLPVLKSEYATIDRLQRLCRSSLSGEYVAELLSDAIVRCDPSKLGRLQFYGTTVDDLRRIFANLAMAQGLTWHFHTSGENVLDLLSICYDRPVSHARCYLAQKAQFVAADDAELQQYSTSGQLAAFDCTKRLCKDILHNTLMRAFGEVRARLHSFVETQCGGLLRQSHPGLPLRIPAPFMADYLQRTGRDIEKDFGVSSSGLSCVACTHPTCPMFLVRCAKRTLQQHLRDAVPELIPGFHKAAMAHPDKTARELLLLIQEGSVLHPPPLHRRDQAVIDKGVTPAGYQSMDSFREDCLEKRVQLRQLRIWKILESQEPGDLELLLERIKEPAGQEGVDLHSMFDAAYARGSR